MKKNFHRMLIVVLLAVIGYGAFAIYKGVGKMGDTLAGYHWWTFAAACALAFGNYSIRFFKWEFYLARLDIRGIPKWDSYLTFFSGFVLTITPGKVGEVFKSVVLNETHGVPVAKTAPIVIAERVTDVIGIVVLIVLGSLGFTGGLKWAAVGAILVLFLLVVIGSRTLSLGMIGLIEKMPGKIGALGPKLREAYESLAVMLQIRNLALPTVLSVVAWLCECLALWIILQGFGETTSVPLAVFFYATSTLVGAIIPSPGGLGVTESALMGQMTELGHVADANASAAMLLVRFATLWFAVIVGFVSLSLLKRIHPNLLSTTEELKPAQ